MINNFKHKGLEELWKKGKERKLPAKSITKLAMILGKLEAATCLENLRELKSLKFHGLKGHTPARYSLKVDENFRVTFEWDNGLVIILTTKTTTRQRKDNDNDTRITTYPCRLAPI